MATTVRNSDKSFLRANPFCSPEREINILLLGQTGVGKTTFINAFANHIVSDTVEQAVNEEMQVIIPSSFVYSDEDTYEDVIIKIGDKVDYEQCNTNGEACTQQCQSFIFPIGDRNLRLIDTPGIGDPRGIEHDTQNFLDILSHIAQYEHLNAICILLKPNQERLDVLFRFCVKELLRHLHVGASENIIFVFTNGRSNFYMPGSTKKLLQVLLDQHRYEYNVEVPFSKTNTFLLDNESFRYLALRKNGIYLDKERIESYTKSWEHSAKEYNRFIAYIATRPLHAVRDTLSLNEAEQLIRKLTRPIAETAKLIEQNLLQAKEHKQNVLRNPQIAMQGIPQYDVKIVQLGHPRTVCISDKCIQVIVVNNQQKLEYFSICHVRCYLENVEQETINNPKLRYCEAIDQMTEKCKRCECHWRQHKHITYEYQTNLTHLNANQQTSLSAIDQRLSDLREEQRKIEDVYKKLSKFLHANAILPINDDILEYIRYFIREEQMKNNAGAKNAEVIAGLEKMMADYIKEIDLFKKTLQNHDPLTIGVIQTEEIFPLVGTLYRLPINGRKIREQVEGLKINQGNVLLERESFIQLPATAASSIIMLPLKRILSAR